MNFRRTKTSFDPRVTYEEKEMHENKLIESPRYTEMTQRDAEMNAKTGDHASRNQKRNHMYCDHHIQYAVM